MVRWGCILMTFWIITVCNSARAQVLEALLSPGSLSSAHQDYKGLSNCVLCHSPGEGVGAKQCLACHEDLQERIQKETGFHRLKAENCASCHPDHQGEAFRMVGWDIERFQHSETGYPLEGLHQNVSECASCHDTTNTPPREKTTTYFLNDNRCIACHEDVHRDELGADCQNCHDVEVPFKEIQFDHSKAAFPLLGAHQQVECQACHEEKVFKGLSFSSCTDCHSDPHNPTLGSKCANCHDSATWEVSGDSPFNHTQTRFPLLGKHLQVACAECHADNQYLGIPFSECKDCHQEDPHRGQFTEDCASCHTEDSFTSSTFEHVRSSYPLEGKHQVVECAECHLEEVGLFPDGTGEAVRYKPLPQECVDCHPDIHLGQFTSSCESCHITEGFLGDFLLFNHDRDSRYPLLGKHSQTTCAKCHKIEEKGEFPSGTGEAIRFVPIDDSCLTCHQDYHSGQLAEDCEQCHDIEGFQPAVSFDHSKSRFVLDGAHTSTQCEDCHPSIQVSDEGSEFREIPLFRPLPPECLSCHEDPHRSSGANRCENCHTTESFPIVPRESFNHNRTRFELSGKHRSAECSQCHVSAAWKDRELIIFKELQRGCLECHQSPHTFQQEDCWSCHTADNWRVSDW